MTATMLQEDESRREPQRAGRTWAPIPIGPAGPSGSPEDEEVGAMELGNASNITSFPAFENEVARDSLYVVVPITVVYSVIFVLGIVGNLSTCIVIHRNRHMQTTTNYYLFSLAVSDLLLLTSGMPTEIHKIWYPLPYPFGETVCILQGVAAETSANATVLTIMAFTVERYVAICHPFMAHTMSKLSRATRLVLALWVLALFLAVPQALQFGVVDQVHGDPSNRRPGDPDLSECTVKRVFIQHTFAVSVVVFFVAPLTVITVLYALIGLRLRSSRRARIRSSQRQQNHVIRMLVAVVVAFCVCWAPFHAQRLVAVYTDTENPANRHIYNYLTYASGVLYFTSTMVNPVLYHIMSNKFREAFRWTLARDFGCTFCLTPEDSANGRWRATGTSRRRGWLPVSMRPSRARPSASLSAAACGSRSSLPARNTSLGNGTSTGPGPGTGSDKATGNSCAAPQLTPAASVGDPEQSVAHLARTQAERRAAGCDSAGVLCRSRSLCVGSAAPPASPAPHQRPPRPGSASLSAGLSGAGAGTGAGTGLREDLRRRSASSSSASASGDYLSCSSGSLGSDKLTVFYSTDTLRGLNWV